MAPKNLLKTRCCDDIFVCFRKLVSNRPSCLQFSIHIFHSQFFVNFAVALSVKWQYTVVVKIYSSQHLYSSTFIDGFSNFAPWKPSDYMFYVFLIGLKIKKVISRWCFFSQRCDSPISYVTLKSSVRLWKYTLFWIYSQNNRLGATYATPLLLGFRV